MARFALMTATCLAVLGTVPVVASAEAPMCAPGDALFAFQSVDLDVLGVLPAAPAGEDREVLWCASSDDPRCSPSMPAPERSSFAPFAFAAAGVPARSQLGAPTWTLLERTSLEGQPLAGVRQRVERPPKA